MRVLLGIGNVLLYPFPVLLYKKKKNSRLKIHAWLRGVLCYIELTPHWAALRHVYGVRKKKKRKLTRKMAYIQTEVLADCHLIFKVDGTGERYSSAPTHARCTPFLSVSMVPDHISPGNLILTFRTPARDCTSYFSSCTPTLLLAVFRALFCFSASVCALPLLSFSSLYAKVTLLKM